MKKQRVDSTSEQVKIAAKSFQDIKPPAHVPLDDRDYPFFDSVIAEFARSEWTNHTLELAALLARAMSDLEHEGRLLREEGSVAQSERGTPVVNPRKTVVQMLAGTILSMRRSLSLHARAQGGEGRDVAKRREQAKKIEGGLMEDDDILARPAH